MSSADFYLYQEAVSSPEVSFSLCGQFSSESPQLLLARRSLIQLYDLSRSLRLVTQFHLQGVVKAMAVLVHSAYDFDLVLLAFDEAKLVTMQYDPSTNSFQTIALHSFELEEYSTRATFNELKITVEPENKCVMLHLPLNRLGIIPVRTNMRAALSTAESDSCCTVLGKSIYLSSFILELSGYQIQQAQSICFTRKSKGEPTLVVVAYEIAGLDITSVTWLGLNFKERKAQVLMKFGDAPTDVVHQIALKPPLMGQLLVCSHSIAHYKDGQVTKHQLKADLDNCSVTLFDPLKLLISTRTGDLYLVLLNAFTENEICYIDDKLDTLKQVMQVKLPISGQYIAAQIVAAGQYVWLGCKIHDSALFRLVVDESYSPVGGSELRKVLNLQTIRMEKLDEMQTLSTAVSAVVSTNSEILLAHGYGKSSYISRIVLSAVPSPSGHIEADSLVRLGEIDRLLRVQGVNSDIYVLATSKAGFTVALRTEDVIENVSDVTDFQTDYTTLLAGRLKGNLIYQVTNVCIRVMTDKGKLVREYPKTWTVQAASYKRYFSLLLADGSIDTTKIDVNAGFQEVQMPGVPIEPEIMSIDITAIHGVGKKGKVLVLGRADGTLQIFDVLTGNLMVSFADAAHGPAVLSEDGAGEWMAVTDPTQRLQPADISFPPPIIREIVLRHISDMLVLFLRTDRSQIYIYQHFGEKLFSRFFRVQSAVYMGEMDNTEEPMQAIFQVPIGKLQSAFMILHPRQCVWVVPDVRHRVLRLHSDPRQIPKAFSPFNYIDSEDGFIQLSNDQLLLTRLDDDLALSLPTEALSIRLPFLDTPRKLVAYEDMVFASFFVEDERGVVYSLRAFVVLKGRGLVEMCNIPRFSTNELITDLAVVNFRRKVDTPTTYLAVSTAVSGGEDVECKGRLFLFGLQNRALTPTKLDYRPTLIGAVTAVAELDGYLLAAVSFEVKMFTYVEEAEPYMEEIAFFRSPYLCIHFDIYQNYALCLDVRKSVYVLGYREAHNQRELLPLGSFQKEHNSLSGGFLLLNYPESDELGVRAVVCDDFDNLYILHTVPWTDKVDKVGELHTGFEVYSISHCGDGLLLCAKEGIIAYLAPLSGYLYRKMHALQIAMLEALPSKAGLNGRGFRHPIMHDRERQRVLADQGNALLRSGGRSGERERLRKTVLDRDQVLSFSYLSSRIQHFLSRNVGSSPSLILPELSQLRTLQDFL